MEREKEIAVEEPVYVAGTTVIPVVMTTLCYQRVNGTVSFIALKQPSNIVVITSTTRKALRISGEEISLEQLILEVPALKDKLSLAI